MDNKKTYWVIGIIIAVLLILLIILGYSFNGRRNKASETEDGSTESIQTESSQSTASEPDTAGETSSESDASPADSAALSQYLQEQDIIMSDMMGNMEVEPTGNASVDFLKGMIPHHRSAIDMSESYLKLGGANAELKKLAEDIIDAQTGEIDEMNRLIEEIEASGKTDTDKEQGYLNSYNKMMASHQHMHHGTSSAKDVEQSFAEGMLMHHQMAVDMSKAILDYTDNDEVRKLAEDIIDAQEKEIQQMQDIINQ